MVDVVVSAQLQQWSFEKPRAQRSDSSASSPDLSHHDTETLRIGTAAVEDSATLDSKETLSLHEKYLSSEEDLSPMEGNSSDSEYDDDEVSIHNFENEYLHARTMSISRFEKGKSCDMAVMVSFVSARPKMIDLATVGSPIHETAQRSASLASLPIAAINKIREADPNPRLSMNVSSSTSRSTSPAYSYESRRPSTGHIPFSHNTSALRVTDSSTSFTDSSTRSSSPSIAERPARPVSVATNRAALPRSSLYLTSIASPTKPFPPLTPLSPDSHSFLSSDPYENSTTSSASPIIKSNGPHKRLRSISQKLSLAKIAISPSKKWDSRVNGKSGQMPPTPSTPYTPTTPQTAPPTGSFQSPKIKLRRHSRISRPTSVRGPSPEVPPVPALDQIPQPRKTGPKMMARGANEREPTLELPPCPDDLDTDSMRSPSIDPVSSIKAKRVRKRKSLMDLL